MSKKTSYYNDFDLVLNKSSNDLLLTINRQPSTVN
jgi:hypothetical protein